MKHFVTFSPCTLSGAVNIPPSKSDVHRAVICAMLSRGVSRISPVVFSDDIRATVSCARALGAQAELTEGVLTVRSANFGKIKDAELDCGESGSTLRFFIPIAAALGINAVFTGKGRLPQRPIGVYLDALPRFGTVCETQGGLPLKISGRLRPGKYEIAGNISSQFITGLLMALPLLNGGSEIILTTPLESAGYIDMTLSAMERFGVKAEKTANGWIVAGNQTYKPGEYATEGDWSQAAFFLCGGAIGGSVSVNGVKMPSVQGDRAAAGILAKFGAEITCGGNTASARHSVLNAAEIDAAQIPDLVPVLAVTAALCKGRTVIKNAGRLRIKESNRLSAIANAINTIGGKASETPDGLIIDGVERFCGCANGEVVDGCNDHRIVMSMAVAAAGSENPITVSDAMSINKSYPDFFTDYNRLGGRADVGSMG